MIKMRQAHVEDLILLAEHAMDDSMKGSPYQRLWAQRHIDCGPAYTAVFEGRVVAAAGVVLTRPGVGDIWITMSRDIDKKSYSFMKDALLAMRGMTDVIAETFELKRIRSRSRIGFAASQRLLEHIGFVRQRRTVAGHYLYIRRF